jgi:hypothetical protein
MELGLFKGGTTKTQKALKKVLLDLNKLMETKDLKRNQILVGNIFSLLST